MVHINEDLLKEIAGKSHTAIAQQQESLQFSVCSTTEEIQTTETATLVRQLSVLTFQKITEAFLETASISKLYKRHLLLH